MQIVPLYDRGQRKKYYLYALEIELLIKNFKKIKT